MLIKKNLEIKITPPTLFFSTIEEHEINPKKKKEKRNP